MTLITFELKRQKDQNGKWPDSLDVIRDKYTAETFIDLESGKEIAYQLPKNSDTFILYSFGENGIDDGGIKGRNPKTGKMGDDILFWPKTQDELKKIDK